MKIVTGVKYSVVMESDVHARASYAHQQGVIFNREQMLNIVENFIEESTESFEGQQTIHLIIEVGAATPEVVVTEVEKKINVVDNS